MSEKKMTIRFGDSSITMTEEGISITGKSIRLGAPGAPTDEKDSDSGQDTGE